ncbi:unnamed protein product [Paramecium pentaurelia]|uniref:Uncharacterized protein n=1 Tax=Paramecium pentaurelia TaxID=43138 RepID=A0A8S1XKV5_9CILI|nr:unnamed protein product [Paramecium pentaurelia]
MCQQNYNRIKLQEVQCRNSQLIPLVSIQQTHPEFPCSSPQKKQSLKILLWISRKKNAELRRIKIKVIRKHYQGDIY